METEQWHLKFDEFGDACDFVVCFQLWNVISAACISGSSLHHVVDVSSFHDGIFMKIFFPLKNKPAQITDHELSLQSCQFLCWIYILVSRYHLRWNKIKKTPPMGIAMIPNVYVRNDAECAKILRFISFRQRLSRCKGIFRLKS